MGWLTTAAALNEWLERSEEPLGDIGRAWKDEVDEDDEVGWFTVIEGPLECKFDADLDGVRLTRFTTGTRPGLAPGLA